METIYNIIIDIIPLLGIFSFIKAIIEYRKTQLWKESEFLSKEIKEFLTLCTISGCFVRSNR